MEKNLEFIGEQLKKLTAIPSPSSYTEKAAEHLMETLRELLMVRTVLFIRETAGFIQGLC